MLSTYFHNDSGSCGIFHPWDDMVYKTKNDFNIILIDSNKHLNQWNKFTSPSGEAVFST